MSNFFHPRLGRLLSVATLGGALGVAATAAPPLSGAIFTTTEDGSVVNENVRYDAKEDVYLDGGPGPHAPSTAAGLPAGDYYFQVTDPSGQDLLSTDHISCRRFTVGEDGFIVGYDDGGTNYEKDKGKWVETSCVHGTGVDLDYGADGAITVQLYPYDNTPNKGGVYKVWATPVDDYEGDTSGCSVGESGACNVNGEDYSSGYFHGFIPAASKTDNYKVRGVEHFEPPTITVKKFHDADMDCTWDADEEAIEGWPFDATDPLGVTNSYTTEYTMYATVAGDYEFVEDSPYGTGQTVSIVDDVIDSCYPDAFADATVTVAGDSKEAHEVVYGNVSMGIIDPCKVYDRDGDGVWDDGDEPFVEGWQFNLAGWDLAGTYHSQTVYTGEDGCAEFEPVFPGTYTVTEGTPTDPGWSYTGFEGSCDEAVGEGGSVEVTVESTLNGVDDQGTFCTQAFSNAYVAGPVDFGTKGYWHNKNGLTTLEAGADANGNGVPDIVEYANTLDPYDDETSYFDDGDEPFDGTFTDGTDVIGPSGDWADGWLEDGTVLAEVSSFLVDLNADGDPREQLAQQLLAFIFNVDTHLDCDAAVIEDSYGNTYVAADLIDAAVDAWTSGTDSERTAIKDVLDAFNNMDAVYYSPCDPPTPEF